jgi:hypothetical protein
MRRMIKVLSVAVHNGEIYIDERSRLIFEPNIAKNAISGVAKKLSLSNKKELPKLDKTAYDVSNILKIIFNESSQDDLIQTNLLGTIEITIPDNITKKHSIYVSNVQKDAFRVKTQIESILNYYDKVKK